MQAPHGHGCSDRAADDLDVLPVGGDEDVDRRGLLMQVQGPPVGLVLEPGVRDAGRIEQRPWAWWKAKPRGS